MNRLAASCFALLASHSTATAVESMDDIAFWVGEGANQAALALDWDGDDSTDEALVWGFRWDGDATGETMLRDVAAADPRLFVKLSTTDPDFGVAVYGLGYDVNGDGVFDFESAAPFDAGGIAIGGPEDGGGVGPNGDIYLERWTLGYWHYGGAREVDGPTDWMTATVGATSRRLTDGDWDGFAVAVTLNADEFPENLVAATPPAAPGDFNLDGRVDAADYTVWRDGLGAPGGFVPGDYAVWADAYGAVARRTDAAAGALAPQIVPSPNACALGFLGCFPRLLVRPRRDS